MTAHNTWKYNLKFGDAQNTGRITILLTMLWVVLSVLVDTIVNGRASTDTIVNGRVSVDTATIVVDDRGALLTYDHSFIEPLEADALFEELKRTVPFAWTTHVLRGENIQSPRQMAWFADDASWVYRFSKNHVVGLPVCAWVDSPVVALIKARVERATGEKFNAALVNLYSNGDEHADWHSDDDPWRES